MTLAEKFEKDGTILSGVQGIGIDDSCLTEQVEEIGTDGKIRVSRMECGDYIVDVRTSGDTILVLADDLAEDWNEDVRTVVNMTKTENINL